MGCIALVRCVFVLRCGLAGVVWYPDAGWSSASACIRIPPQPNHTVTPTHIEPEQYNPWITQQISCKLLRMDVLTFETCWALNNEMIKQVTSSWSIFIQRTQYLSNNTCLTRGTATIQQEYEKHRAQKYRGGGHEHITTNYCFHINWTPSTIWAKSKSFAINPTRKKV